MVLRSSYPFKHQITGRQSVRKRNKCVYQICVCKTRQNWKEKKSPLSHKTSKPHFSLQNRECRSENSETCLLLLNTLLLLLGEAKLCYSVTLVGETKGQFWLATSPMMVMRGTHLIRNIEVSSSAQETAVTELYKRNLWLA